MKMTLTHKHLMCTVACYLALCIPTYAHAESIDPKGLLPVVTTSFLSRPDIRAPVLDILTDDERATQAYIFVNPQSPFYQSGPNIYDSHGELIWAGAVDGLAANAYGFHVCDYDGSIANHLCFFQGVQMFGRGHGYGVILNDHYEVVRVVQSEGGSDIHEFSPIDEGRRALVTKYRIRRHDFADESNPQGLQFIEEGVFTEIDLQNNTIAFQWGSFDHIKPGNAERPIELEHGQTAAMDYLHINSVEKNWEGDYLISARHTSAVYKVSGIDGSIIWTLSAGPESTFMLDNFMIWGAHHARWRSENRTHTIITLFNNGYDGVSSKTDGSSGMLIIIDHTLLRATLLKEYGAQEKLGAVSKGSYQTLPNKNVLLGWGSEPHITEYLEDGTLVFHASVSGGGDIYRAFKSDWVGKPSYPPALWTYARTTQSQMAFYVSWNGATEVRSWKFYVRSGPRGVGPFVLAGTVKKGGFETNFTTPEYNGWAFAEAVGHDGTSLGNSSIIPTWVPSDSIRKECDDWKCPDRQSAFLPKYNLLPDLDGLASQSIPEGQGKLVAWSIDESSWDEVFFALTILMGVLSVVVLLGFLALGKYQSFKVDVTN